MSQFCGFFPSTKENPRKYGNTWINNLLDRVLSDGVFATPQGTPSTDLQVFAASGLNVTVKAGRGRFKCGDETFTFYNDSDLTLTISTASDVRRIDYVAVRIDKNEDVKNGVIMIKTGNTVTGAEPVLLNNAYQKEYLLAKITVEAGAQTITQDKISDRRGRETPWVTSLVQQVDTSTLMEQFDTAFWNWFDNVTKNISGTVMFTQRSASYLTQTTNQSVITIPTNLQYQKGDVLTVFVNGIRFELGKNYSESADAKTITLAIPLPVAGTKIDFEVLKNINVTNVRDYVDRLVKAENNIDLFRLTSDTAGPKVTIRTNLFTELLNLGIGVHTFDSIARKVNNPKGTLNFKGVFFRTDANTGWIIAVSDSGDVYYNTYVSGAWVGWRAVYDVTPNILHTSTGVPMSAATTITPTKKLSECRNGWCLLWCGVVNGTVQDARWFTTFIPKVTGAGVAPTSDIYYFTIPYSFDDTTGNIELCGKRLVVSDNQIKGSDGNTKGNNMLMYYRACIEY